MTQEGDTLLELRGQMAQLGAYVVGAVFDRAGQYAGFGLGDGSLHVATPGATGAWARIAVHAGAMLALAPDAQAGGFVSGGDDGAFRRLGADGNMAEIVRFRGKWIEQVASHADAKTGLLACAVGKNLMLYNRAGSLLKTLEHPSTVTGIAFDSRGKRIAASHYNGASLWFVAAKTDTPRRLEWKGSHIGVALQPDGASVVTAMQENALHGWRLADGQHMRMSGYPAKTQSLSFTQNGKWLASSGADTIVLWPFFAGGPMGKPPMEMAGGLNVLCTRVACHPKREMAAAGFADGSVLLADIASARILPVARAGNGAVSALSWSPDGGHLAFGTDQGFAALVDLTPRSN